MKKRYEGQITVALGLIFPVYLTLMLLLLGAVQGICTRSYFSYACFSAQENVEASFCRELLTDYDLYAVYEEKDSVEKIVTETLEFYENPHTNSIVNIEFPDWLWNGAAELLSFGNFLPIRFTDSEILVTDKKNAVQDGGYYLRQQILQSQEDTWGVTLVGKGLELIKNFISSIGDNESEFQELTDDQISQVKEGLSDNSGSGETTTSEEDREQMDAARQLIEVKDELVGKPIVSIMLGSAATVSTSEIPVGEAEIDASEESDEEVDLSLEWTDFIKLVEGIWKKLKDFAQDNVEHVALAEYYDQHTTTYLTAESGEHYELEYVLTGKSTDSECLESTMQRFLLFRTALNLVAGAVDVQLQEQIGEVADRLEVIPLIGVALAVAANVTLNIANAFAEAVIDGRRLLNGKNVAVIKSGTQWMFVREGPVGLIGELLSTDYVRESDEDGLGYDTYVAILMLLGSDSAQLSRMGDVIEWNLKEYDSSFTLKDCVLEAKVTVTAKIRRSFYQFSDEWSSMEKEFAIDFSQ